MLLQPTQRTTRHARCGARALLAGLLVLQSSMLASCSTYRAVAVPPATEVPTGATDSAKQLEKGQYVRLYLRDGRTFEGEVIDLSATEVVLEGEPTNRGYVDIRVELADIERCEVAGLTPVGVMVRVAAGVAGAALASLAWAMRDFGEGWN
jgi:hypothetical protein